MDPHFLRTFVTVARLGSFSEAARELGYTQSAVSQQIAALESDLGSVLLGRRPVEPTEAGARLLEHAGPLLMRLAAARADLARLREKTPSKVVVGSSPLALVPRLARVLGPGSEVRVLGRDAVVHSVLTAEIGIGLVDGVTAPNDPVHLPDAGLVLAAVAAERPVAVAMPADHPLAGRAHLRLGDLSDARWIEAPETAVPTARLRALSGFDGFRNSVRYHGTDVRGLLTLVAAGHGLAVLPLDVISGGAAAVPLSAPRLVHRVDVVHGRDRSPVVAELAAALAQGTAAEGPS